MSDYQHIPAGIRAVLAAKGYQWNDHAADLATHYASLCREVNVRLRRCADYLRGGMRSEAIHLAECQPKLVEAATSLLFPEQAAWAELCVANGAPAPPVLAVEGLDAVTDAYAREQALRPLLSRHRLLALAQAPAKARLEVLRLLATEDADNRAWPEAIVLLEAVRLRELRTEFRAALKSGDTASIEDVASELIDQPWRSSLPADLRTSAEKAGTNLRARRALADLTALAPQLLAAYKGHGQPGANGHLAEYATRWRELAATTGVTIAPELAEQVQPALDLQAAEDRRREEMEEVKPFQHFLEPGTYDPPVPVWYRRRLVVAGGGLAAAAAAAACIYFFYLRTGGI